MVCVIDTHALVWYLTDDKRLGNVRQSCWIVPTRGLSCRS